MIQPHEMNIDQIASKLIAYLRNELDDATLTYDSPLTQLRGGFETAIYRFQLKGVQEELNRPLVLRLYPTFYGPENALWESSIQNALAKEGYPVAKAYVICADKSILGGAFFIMDFLSGTPMMAAPIETIPGILGRAHAVLHGIDPDPLVKSLRQQGISEGRYRLDRQVGYMHDVADELPWIRDGVNWLLEHWPPEPERLAICHGDFHPLNILVQDGEVTGVLDWPGFLIGDPALDVGNTVLLTTVPFKHLASTLLGPAFAGVDWDNSSRQYLDAYQAQLPLDSTNVDYYRVRRSINALIEGYRGHQLWQHPAIRRDLIDFIHQFTGVRITLPG
jgi:aminoglycoside phosphotransferase (APT) family kinase protein